MPSGTVLPLAIVEDQRSSAHARGVAVGKELDPVNNFMNSYRESLKDYTAIEEANKRIETLYDPEKLATEQVLREQETLLNAEKIKQSQIGTEYAEENILADLEASTARTENIRATTNKLELDNSLTERYGDAEAKAKLDLLSSRVSRARSGSLSPTGSGQASYGKMDLARDKLDQQRELAEQTIFAKQLSSLDRNILALREKLAIAKDSGDTSLAETYGQSLLELTKERNTLKQSYQQNMQGKDIEAEKQELEVLQKRNLEQQESILLNKQKNSISKENVAFKLTDSYADEIRLAKQDIGMDGKPNYGASIDASLKLAALHKNSPTETAKQYISSSYIEAVKDIGGTRELINYIDTNVKDPKEKRVLKKSIYGAAIATNNLDELAPEQQQLVSIGLTHREIADPEKTTDDFISLLSGNASNVKSNELKNLRLHPYFARASLASQNNKQPFTVFPNVIESSPDPITKASGATQVLTFRGADGREFHSELPRSKEDIAMWNFLESVSHKSTLMQSESARLRQANTQLEDANRSLDTSPLQQVKFDTQNASMSLDDRVLQKAVTSVTKMLQSRNINLPEAQKSILVEQAFNSIKSKLKSA